jgi:hypothetical protein
MYPHIVGDIAVPKIGLLRQLGDIRRNPPRHIARDRWLFYGGPAMVTGVTASAVIQSYW